MYPHILNHIIYGIATIQRALYKILIPNYTDRYFLLENRQRTNLYEQQYTHACGNTVGLPATGLLITELGPGAGYPISSILDSPQGIRPADNVYIFPGDAGDTYKPGN